MNLPLTMMGKVPAAVKHHKKEVHMHYGKILLESGLSNQELNPTKGAAYRVTSNNPQLAYTQGAAQPRNEPLVGGNQVHLYSRNLSSSQSNSRGAKPKVNSKIEQQKGNTQLTAIRDGIKNYPQTDKIK